METYTPPKPFEEYPGFNSERQRVLDSLCKTQIDKPLADLIKNLNTLPYLFTLQCCYGHFLTIDGEEVFEFDVGRCNDKVEYRLAYLAFCIENSTAGKTFAQRLEEISLTVGRGMVQFCSAQWFWDQWPNSYILQVMLPRYKDKDSVVVGFQEAVKIKQARDEFFAHMEEFVSKMLGEVKAS